MDRPKPRFKASPLAATTKFRKALGDWFARVGKDYPWRRTREPYPILVSEMMLQQTQIATVLGKGYYTRFLEKFPDKFKTFEEALAHTGILSQHYSKKAGS